MSTSSGRCAPIDLSCASLAFGEERRRGARRRGRPVRARGRHLHQLVDPDAVTAAILRLQVDPK